MVSGWRQRALKFSPSLAGCGIMAETILQGEKPLTDETEIQPPEEQDETVPEETEVIELEEKPRKPARTINLYTWVAIVAGVLILAIGYLAGFTTQPLVARAFATPTPKKASLRDVVIAQTRHFIGDKNAPVVIVEFGDFQ